MLQPIVEGFMLSAVGIAILTQMRTSIVFPNILGCHAFAELTLAGIFTVTADEIITVRKLNSPFRKNPVAE